MNAEINIYITERDSYISAEEFIDSASNLIKLLKEVEINVSVKKEAVINWVIKKLGTGSATMTLEGITETHINGLANDVIIHTIEGLNVLHEESITPPHFSEDAIKYAKNIADKIGKRFKSITVSSVDRETNLTEGLIINADKLLTTSFIDESGTITGSIKLISLLRRPYYQIVDEVTNSKVTCEFLLEDIKEVLKAIGHDMVSVSGVISYGMDGRPKKIQKGIIEFITSNIDLPTTDDILKLNLDLSGGLSFEEFLKRRHKESNN